MPLPTRLNTARPQSQGLHCAIEDTFYRLVSLADASPMIRTAPLQPPRIDTTSNAEDIRPEFGTTFSLSDFTGGEGLDFAHQRTPTERDPTRYWDSSGVDTSRPDPGDRTTITLLHNVALVDPISSDVRMTTRDGVLYATSATSVRRSSNPTAATPAFGSEDPHAGDGPVTVLDLAFLGDVLHAALGSSGIHQRDSGGIWTHWSDLAATRVWQAKSRIVASTGTALYEAKATTTSVLLHTLDAGHHWTEVVDVGSHILASATDGVIYSFALAEDTGTVTIATRTPVSPDAITALATLPGTGLVFYALAPSTTTSTTSSIHRASVTDAGTVTDASTIRDFTHATDNQVVSSILPDDETVYFGKPGETWRYDLVTTGRSRHLSFDGTGRVTGLAVVADRILAGIAGSGVHREELTYVPTGYLISPLIDHFSGADKSWAGISMDVVTVPGGQVALYFSTNPEAILDADHDSWTLIKVLSSGTDITESVIGESSRYLAVKVVLASNSSATIAPELRSFTTRAFPGPGDVLLTLPINTSDQVEAPGRQRLTVPGLGRLVYDTLRNIEGKTVRVELFDPYELVQGLVDEVASSLPLPDAKGSLTMTTVVRVRGRRISALDTASVTGLFGTDHLLATEPVLAEVT